MNEETAKTSSEESKKYASNKGYQTTVFKMNVQDDKSVQDMVDFVVKEFGRLDYAVNCAGVSNISSWANSSDTNDPYLQRLTTESTHPSPRLISIISSMFCASTPVETCSVRAHGLRRCASRILRLGAAGTARVILGEESLLTLHLLTRSSAFRAKVAAQFRSMHSWESPKWQVSIETDFIYLW